MKRIISLFITAVILTLPSFGQENIEKLKKLETLEQQSEKINPPDTLALEEAETAVADEEVTVNDTSVLRLGDDVLVIEDTGNETVIRIGKKGIRINDDDGNRGYNDEDFSDFRYRSGRGERFSGHLSGIEMGFNGYLTSFWGTALEPEDSYFDLNSSKSTVFNIIAPSVSLGITKRFGLVTSLGLNFNNYRFDGNNSISVDAGGVIIPEIPLSVEYEKSKLATVYAVLPVILEGQIPVSHNSSINIGAGVIGAVKLGSHTKVVYYDDGKEKVKNRDDFSLNLLRYGVTVRAGYEMVQVYGTCYLSPMFEQGKAPELYPFEVGISLTFND